MPQAHYRRINSTHLHVENQKRQSSFLANGRGDVWEASWPGVVCSHIGARKKNAAKQEDYMAVHQPKVKWRQYGLADLLSTY